MARSLGTLTIDLVARFGGFKEGFSQAERIAQERSKKINAAVNSIGVAVAASAGIAATSLVAMVKSSIDAAAD